MLSKELKEMELNKLVKRTVYPEIPVLIEYEPTVIVEHSVKLSRK